MRKFSMPAWPALFATRRGHCRLALSRGAVAVLGVDAPRFGRARKTAPRVAERPLADITTAAPDELAAQIATALDEAGGKGMPVYATFSDDLVRYFIVTPPANSARMHDLRAAAGLRFQMLYGESAAAWQLVADWQAGAPFLACAVSQRLHTALQLAVRTQRGCLATVAPNFVAAWNRWRRRVAADAWLATLHGHTLTLGLVSGAARHARLAAVRNLMLPEQTPPLAWLQEQIVRAALLDNMAPPSVLHVHGAQIDAWYVAAPVGAAPASVTAGTSAETSAETSAGTIGTPADGSGISVRWCLTGNAAVPALAQTTALPALAQLAWGGAAP